MALFVLFHVLLGDHAHTYVKKIKANINQIFNEQILLASVRVPCSLRSSHASYSKWYRPPHT